MPPADPETEPAGFEPSLQALEQTVSALESGDLDLDAALAAYERGVRLLSRCKGLLDRAERQVALLTSVDNSGQPQTAPFDHRPPSGPAAADDANGSETRAADDADEPDDLPF